MSVVFKNPLVKWRKEKKKQQGFFFVLCVSVTLKISSLFPPKQGDPS